MTDVHVRQQVRDAIAAKVNAVAALTGKTFTSRTSELAAEELPAAIVVFEGETIENKGSNRPGIGIQKRNIQTGVYIFARSLTKIEEALDILTAEVEKKVFEDSTLQGVAAQTTIESVEPDIRSSPTLPTGLYRILFSSDRKSVV